MSIQIGAVSMSAVTSMRSARSLSSTRSISTSRSVPDSPVFWSSTVMLTACRSPSATTPSPVTLTPCAARLSGSSGSATLYSSRSWSPQTPKMPTRLPSVFSQSAALAQTVLSTVSPM